jgi:signal recognition particle GTPase
LTAEVVKKLSGEIVTDANVKSSAYIRNSLSLADVELQLTYGTVQKVQWKRLYKAKGDDGTKSLKDHGKRFHTECDDKGATMTVFKVRGRGHGGIVSLFVGYNSEGWTTSGYGVTRSTLNPKGFISEINPADHSLKSVWRSGTLAISISDQ